MASQGRTIVLQLSSKKTKDESNLRETEPGQFSLTLNPQIRVPFYANPKVALYNLSFTNSFKNVSRIELKNATLRVLARDLTGLSAGPPDGSGGYITTVAAPPNNPLEIIIPDGNYTLSEIEIEIAKQMVVGDIGTTGTWAHYLQAVSWGMFFEGPGPEGVASPDVPEHWGGAGIVSTEQSFTFSELSMLLDAAKIKQFPAAGSQARYYKPLTLRHNPNTHRIEAIQMGYVEWLQDSTLPQQLFGFEDSQLGTGNSVAVTPTWTFNPGISIGTGNNKLLMDANIMSVVQVAKDAPKLQNVRAVGFHLPSLVSSSYDRNGDEFGAQIANVPLLVPPGAAQSWEANAPLFVPINAAGSVIDRIDFFITNEDGRLLDNQGSRFEATIAISWGAVQGQAPPPSSFAARTNIQGLLQPWSDPRTLAS
jgi:hypothetical protein